jgi:hypothetical protein
LINQIGAEICRHGFERALKERNDDEQSNNNIKAIPPLERENSIDKRLKYKGLNKP